MREREREKGKQWKEEEEEEEEEGELREAKRGLFLLLTEAAVLQ